MKNIRWIRLARFTLVTVFMLLIGIDLSVAWVFVEALTSPGCPIPDPIENGTIPEEIQLQTVDGLSIPAWYYPSQNGAAVITLGGLQGARGTALPPAGPLIEGGFGVLQIGSRACATPVQPVTLGAEEVLDAEAGLEFLLSRQEVDAERIGIFGFSMGGVGAIRTAAKNPTISAVVAEGGYYNLGDDFVEPGPNEVFTQKFFLCTIAGIYWLRTGVNPWEINPLDDLGQISPRPVFLIFGEFEAESGRAGLQFDAAKEPKTLWIVPGGNHGQNHWIAQEEYERRVVEFFEESLDK